MQTVRFEARVTLPCSEVFNLASNIDQYRDFLPMLKAADIEARDGDGNGARVRFVFDLGGSTLGRLAESLGVKTEQLTRMKWTPEKEITGESLSGPLKSIFMRGRLEKIDDRRTKIDVEIQFETGYGWFADTIAKGYIKDHGERLVKNIDAEIAKFKARRDLKL